MYSRSNKPNSGYTIPYIRRNKGHYREQAPTMKLDDYGPYPFAFNIEAATKANQNYRTALWTGPHLQLTLMSLKPGEDIGLERHDDLDQFIRIEQGKGVVMMGDNPDTPSIKQVVSDDYAFIIPAGTWHNLTNIGTVPLKLYSIYTPVQHPFGTVQPTKADAEAAEADTTEA